MISASYMRSPMCIMTYLKSSTEIFPSLSESNTFIASTTSLRVSLSLPRSLTKFSSDYKLNWPLFVGSTFLIISEISLSVGFKFMARTTVPSSEVCTKPSLFLSNSMKISLISLARIELSLPPVSTYTILT